MFWLCFLVINYCWCMLSWYFLCYSTWSAVDDCGYDVSWMGKSCDRLAAKILPPLSALPLPTTPPTIPTLITSSILPSTPLQMPPLIPSNSMPPSIPWFLRTQCLFRFLRFLWIQCLPRILHRIAMQTHIPRRNHVPMQNPMPMRNYILMRNLQNLQNLTLY